MATDTSGVRAQLAERATQSGDVEAAEKPVTIGQLIDRQRTEIARALPSHMDADRLARIATTVIKTTPRLMECTSTSLLGALMLSAQTGLEPGPLGHVYFVPRRIKGTMECQWQLGYRGIIELARRSGNLASIEAREVCEQDLFEFRYGLDERLVHEPYMGGDRGEIVAFWGLAKFVDGGHYFLVMSKADIDMARARSDSGAQGKGPWASDYAAMGRKTVVRRMMPFLPLASEQAAVIARDEAVTRVGVGESISADIAVEGPAPVFIEAREVTDGSAVGDADGGGVEGTAAVAPPPDGDPGFVAMSQAQQRKLFALLRERDIQGDARFPWAEARLGRPVESFSELSKADAGALIDELEREDAA